MIYEASEDSFLLAKYVEKYSRGRVLDMGSGSGYLAEIAFKKTKDVIAVDINKEAVNLVKSKGINAIQSDLFSNVNGKFNLIIFNPPYLPADELLNNDLEIIGGKNGWETIERFFEEANNYLEEDGTILLLFSSLTNKRKVDKIIKEKGFKFKLLEEEMLFFERLYVYIVEKGF